MYVCMYEKVATVTVSIEETVSLGQGERGPDRDSYFPTRELVAHVTHAVHLLPQKRVLWTTLL